MLAPVAIAHRGTVLARIVAIAPGGWEADDPDARATDPALESACNRKREGAIGDAISGLDDGLARHP